ncbi:AMP-dependent synthetase/ligase [Penicillium frequentans]|uniref:AMP-dependent synthetase/ligase n=1 Tax=Penicillium frequentans TaxID=3151616 RepID=A0AAD6CKH5_9EURO|nr:AMP-dependent synthetase/ligase [Penicillium glabrum]
MVGLNNQCLFPQRFPNDPIFTQLQKLSRTFSGVIIHDDYGIDTDYRTLVADVTHLRALLREKVPRDWLDSRGLFKSNAGSIGIMTASCHHLVVGFLATAALGGKSVPLPINPNQENFVYMIDKANVRVILTDSSVPEEPSDIQGLLDNGNGPVQMLSIERSKPNMYSDMEIDEDTTFAAKETALILFTSGSTGRPKAAAIPRSRLFFKTRMDPDELYLMYRPLHWVGTVLPPIGLVLQGGRARSLKSGAYAAEIWEVLKEGTITGMFISPVYVKTLQEHYEANIRHLTAEKHNHYLCGASKLRRVITSGSVMDPSAVEFWKNLTNMPIIARYASTETGVSVFATSPGDTWVDRCVGELVNKASIKLSDGDEGHLSVKMPGMFTHYLGDEEATKAAFDEEGFFRTGDIFRRVGNKYFFQGRASSDWIRYSLYKVTVSEVEKELKALPYISEAYVLPIMDYEVRELVGAIVRLRDSSNYLGQESGLRNPDINLCKIRQDLSSKLEIYKLPTILRILRAGEGVPLSVSSKVLKPKLREMYFKLSGYRPKDYSEPGVEFWEKGVDLEYIHNAGGFASS